MKKLERELGATLIERTAHGVRLTAAGEALRDGARFLLAQANRLEDRVRQATDARTLAIGMLADTTDALGTQLLENVTRRP